MPLRGREQEGAVGVLRDVSAARSGGAGASEGDALKGPSLCPCPDGQPEHGGGGNGRSWCSGENCCQRGTTAAGPSGRTAAEVPVAPSGKAFLLPYSLSVPLVGCAGLTAIFPLTSKRPCCCFRSVWGEDF